MSTIAPPITLTESAAKELKRVFETQQLDEGTMLRVVVNAGGCSGFSYGLEPETHFDPEKDDKTEQHGIEVVVNKKFSIHLEGTTLDFYEGLDRRGFTFNNPNAVKTCGCGSSFQV